jgi:hypothetical protein
VKVGSKQNRKIIFNYAFCEYIFLSSYLDYNQCWARKCYFSTSETQWAQHAEPELRGIWSSSLYVLVSIMLIIIEQRSRDKQNQAIKRENIIQIILPSI